MRHALIANTRAPYRSHFGRVILRSIVDDDDFDGRKRLAKHTPDAFGQISCAVIDRDQYADAVTHLRDHLTVMSSTGGRISGFREGSLVGIDQGTKIEFLMRPPARVLSQPPD